jgi:hypothetical protein
MVPSGWTGPPTATSRPPPAATAVGVGHRSATGGGIVTSRQPVSGDALAVAVAVGDEDCVAEGEGLEEGTDVAPGPTQAAARSVARTTVTMKRIIGAS